MTTEAQPSDTSAIVKRIGLKLPASARIDSAEQFNGQDNAARLIVTLTDKDWQNLLATLPMGDPDQPPFSAEANFHLGPDEGRWNPNAAAKLTTVQIPWKDGAESLNLGVAPVEPGQVRVFVFWHEL